MKLEGFQPYAGKTVAGAVASAATLLPMGNTVRVANLSATAAEIVYIRMGGADVVATNQDLALLPGQAVYLNREPMPYPRPGYQSDLSYIALLAASGTPSVNLVGGNGSM